MGPRGSIADTIKSQLVHCGGGQCRFESSMAKRRNQKPTKASKASKPNKAKRKPSGEGSFVRPKRKAQSVGEPPEAKKARRHESPRTLENGQAGGGRIKGERKGNGGEKNEWRKGGGKMLKGKSKMVGKGSKGYKDRHDVDKVEGDVRMKKSEVKARIREHKTLIKKNFGLVQEVVFLWEKLRPGNVTPAQKAKLVTMILGKIKGRIAELVKNHRASRVVQFCLKEGSDLQRKQIMQEVQESMLELSKDKYGRHLVLKLVNCLPEEHVGSLVKAFRGHIMTLLRHNYGTDVIADLYHNATKEDKVSMQIECYSIELSLQQQVLFGQDQPLNKELDMSLETIISDLDKIRRASIFRDLTENLNYVLEKGLLHPHLVHILIKEYLMTAKSVLVEDLVRALSETGDGIMKMLHTKEGAASAVMVLAYGSNKIRKSAIKGLKGYVKDVAIDEWGHAVLITALRVVDDTALLNKIIVQEIKANLVDICRDQYGSRVILSILNPEVLDSMPEESTKMLNPKERRVKSKKTSEKDEEEEGLEEEERGEEEQEEERVLGQSLKDPADRLQSILTDGPGSLLDCLLELCVADGPMLLKSQFGSNVWFEIASGGGGPFASLVEKKLAPVHECVLKACLEPIDGSKSSNLEAKQIETITKSCSDDGNLEDQPDIGLEASDEISNKEDLEDDMDVLPDEFEANAEDLEVPDDSSLEEFGSDDEIEAKPEVTINPVRKKKQASSKLSNTHIFKSRCAQYALQRIIEVAPNSPKGKNSLLLVKLLWESVFAGRCQEYFGNPGELILVSLVDCEVEDIRKRARGEVDAAINCSIDEWVAPLKKIQYTQKVDLWKKIKKRKKRRKIQTEEKKL